jgi:predicted lipoprotein
MIASTKKTPVVPIAVIGVLVLVLWRFPLFHVVPLTVPAAVATSQPAAFDPAAAAAKIWRMDLPAAAARAVELRVLAPALRAHADTARATFAKSSGLGASYYFVRGSGKVVARERNVLRLAIDGAPGETITIRLGPVFGNTVRDGCGFLDVNAFPGLQEFNALSAELNALVEKSVLPLLRDKAVAGASVRFAGCAEAPESAPDAGESLLTLVPIQAEVR